MYECLVGYPPFYAEEPMATCRKIVNWKKTLMFPKNLNPAAEDILRRLITDSSKRLGWEEIKAHPFFRGLDWDSIRRTKAPIVPDVRLYDTRSPPPVLTSALFDVHRFVAIRTHGTSTSSRSKMLQSVTMTSSSKQMHSNRSKVTRMITAPELLARV